MSDETEAAVEKAIAAHIADLYPGHVMVAFALQTKSIIIDEVSELPRSHYYRMFGAGQDFDTGVFLATVLQRDVMKIWDDLDKED